MKPFKISIDAGKHTTNAYFINEDLKEVNDSFPSKIGRTYEQRGRSIASYVVSEGDDETRYLIGEDGDDYNYEISKKINLHKLAIYTMIHKYVANNQSVELAVGCPISTFENVQLREEYKQFIKGTGKIKFTVDGITKTFTIDKIIAYPESSGLIFLNTALYQDKTVGIVDIGGLNINAQVYSNNRPISKTNITENKGAHILTNDLRLELNREYGIELESFIMGQIIKEGSVRGIEASGEFIENFYKNFLVSTLYNAMKKKGWSVDFMDIVFIGGGSTLLQKYIELVFPNAVVSSSAQLVNVKGGYALL